MSSGFNTDVTYSGEVFHIQTEDRGAPHQVIDTALYQNGRVLLRKSFCYAEFERSPEFTQEWLRRRVEEHHRSVIEDLRGGILDEEITAAKESTSANSVQIELLNPTSWLADGNVSLEVQVSRKVDRQPEARVRVDAEIEGSVNDLAHTVFTDAQGRAKIDFALPALDKADPALVITATTSEGREKIRFAMRSKARSSVEDAAPQS